MASKVFSVLICGMLAAVYSAQVHIDLPHPMGFGSRPNDTADTGEFRRDNIDERGPYFEGDMVLNEEQMADLKSGIVGSSYRWPGGRIPYQIDASFTSTERTTITTAMSMIQAATCIRFFPRTSEANYVYIRRGAAGSGCYSDVGRQSSYNTLNLDYNGCIWSGTAAHELIHAIGFYHEQSRPDRDSFVTINFSNIPSANQFNFNKYSTSQVTTYAPYDFDSIMHYSAYAFAINTATPTIYPRDSSVALSRLGQRTRVSSYDAQKINAMYSGIC